MKKAFDTFVLSALISVMAIVGALADEKPINEASTVEYMHFRLVEGADPNDFLRETLAVDPILEEYDGFVARHLARNDDGSWVEVVYWETLEAAEAALPRFIEDPRTVGFLSLVDADSMSVKYSTLFEF